MQGSIGTVNERDLYGFRVTAPGAYTIETAGNTDCVLRLFGPETPTILVAEDDDSGPGANSRIVANLEPGTYFAEVRHYSPTGTGSYSISVKSWDEPLAVANEWNIDHQHMGQDELEKLSFALEASL